MLINEPRMSSQLQILAQKPKVPPSPKNLHEIWAKNLLNTKKRHIVWLLNQTLKAPLIHVGSELPVRQLNQPFWLDSRVVQQHRLCVHPPVFAGLPIDTR